MIFNNDVSNLDADILISVLYTVMLTLHNHVSLDSISKPDYFKDSLDYYFREVMDAIGSDVIMERIKQSVLGSVRKLKTISFQQFKDALVFLAKSNLITLTVVTQVLDNQEDVLMELQSLDCKYQNKSDLLARINICIKYPMFYVALLKDIIKPNIQLPSYLLGGIVECYVRGLLVDSNSSLSKCSYEYHDQEDRKIDYINCITQMAIEFTISNKRKSKTNFHILPETYTKILLTKDKEDKCGDIRQEIYYKFIYDLTEDKCQQHKI